MCGICGIINYNGVKVDSLNLKSMMKVMKHRGPDDEGTFIHDNVGIGHVRLSIIDLSPDGRQPFECNDGRFYISYNGEIYNYLELREQLKHDFKFKTQTDTEVLLYMWKKWGAEGLHRLNGMFSFAVYDKQNGEVFIARDRFGVKPLYYYHDNSVFVFASEIRPILQFLPQLKSNDQAIYDYLAYDRVNHTDNTFFRGIKKLQHGHFIHLNASNSTFRIHRWYNLRESLKKPFKDAEEYKNALAESIKLRLRSDVPVGALLSGGIDSSAIVSLWQNKFNAENLNTFSAVYGKCEHGDESDYINLYKPHIKNMWFCKPAAEDLFNDISALISCIEEPFPTTSIYAQYKIQELVSRHVTVVLSGQGADEALGGYHYFFGYYYKELFKTMKWLRLFSEGVQFIRKHNSSLALRSFAFFMLPTTIQNKLYHHSKEYISFKPDSPESKTPAWYDLYSSISLKDSFLDHFEYKFEHLLLWGDKISMNFSTEMRFPFLDFNLVEKTIGIESKRILSGGTTKLILREALKDILPETIRTRKSKIGFETPQRKWFAEPIFRTWILELFNSPEFRQRGYVDAEKVIRMFKRHLSGEKDFSSEIWKCINLEIWFRKFFDRN